MKWIAAVIVIVAAMASWLLYAPAGAPTVKSEAVAPGRADGLATDNRQNLRAARNNQR